MTIYTMEEFANLDLKSLEEKCSQGDHSIPAEEHDAYFISGKPSCSDCYYDQLSDLLEQHPIGLPSYRPQIPRSLVENLESS